MERFSLTSSIYWRQLPSQRVSFSSLLVSSMIFWNSTFNMSWPPLVTWTKSLSEGLYPCPVFLDRLLNEDISWSFSRHSLQIKKAGSLLLQTSSAQFEWGDLLSDKTSQNPESSEEVSAKFYGPRFNVVSCVQAKCELVMAKVIATQF